MEGSQNRPQQRRWAEWDWIAGQRTQHLRATTERRRKLLETRPKTQAFDSMARRQVKLEMVRIAETNGEPMAAKATFLALAKAGSLEPGCSPDAHQAASAVFEQGGKDWHHRRWTTCETAPGSQLTPVCACCRCQPSISLVNDWPCCQ